MFIVHGLIKGSSKAAEVADGDAEEGNGGCGLLELLTVADPKAERSESQKLTKETLEGKEEGRPFFFFYIWCVFFLEVSGGLGEVGFPVSFALQQLICSGIVDGPFLKAHILNKIWSLFMGPWLLQSNSCEKTF